MSSSGSSECECLFCATGFDHRQFVLAIVDKRHLVASPHTVSIYWDYSRQPFHRMQQHNRDLLVKPGPKETKDAAGYNLMLLQLGPFHAHAHAFINAMRRQSTKSPASQIRCAFALASVWAEKADTEQTETLRAYVDDEHANTFQALIGLGYSEDSDEEDDDVKDKATSYNMHTALTHAQAAIAAYSRNQQQR